MDNSYTPREWQANSFKKISKAISAEENVIIPVNACVGSGKTDLACYSFGKTILENKDKKTVSVFVSPRIKLCNQQTEAIEEFIDRNFDLKHSADYVVESINCTDDKFNRKSGSLYSKHVIFVFCEASLWGTEDNGGDPERRWHLWLSNFKKWKDESGYSLGAVFYDEAHNYEDKKDKILKLSEMFKVSLLASGTPSYFQKELTKKNRALACECPPAEAMEKKMICKPSLNMVKGNADIDFPRAVAAVLKRESEICKNEVFDSRILVNCSSIDQIKSILDHKWFDGKIGKDFHVITIHSSKKYSADNENTILDCRIDNDLGIGSQEAYDAIESFDTGYFKDSLPVLVFQVGMIGEGINVKCFNAVIVTTHTEKTAMQQIGRAVRNCFKDGKSKIEDGHANVYAFMENKAELQQLVINLQSFDLTDDCFTWGKLLDVATGSGAIHNKEFDQIGDLNSFEWSDMSDIDILQIMSAAEIKCSKRLRNQFVEDLLSENPKLVEEFMKALAQTDYSKTYGCSKAVEKFSCEKFKEELDSNKEKTDKKDNEKESADKDEKGSEENPKKAKNDNITITRDVILDHLIMLSSYIETHKDVFKRLYFSKGKKMLLAKIFGNNVIAEFFSRALNDEVVKKMIR